MIPSARFGDVILNIGLNDYIVCDLYSLYDGGIESVANNKEFCLFLLVDAYRTLSFHDRQVMSFDGEITREQAKLLFNDLDETSHLFYTECLTILRNTIGVKDRGEVAILESEAKFRFIADKVIKDFGVSEPEYMDDTFQEYAMLEFKVANLKLIDHITEGLLVSY